MLCLYLKVSLSLQEKQRLAQEQENQRHYKSQPSITPVTSNQPAKPKSVPISKPAQPRDLTSSLMNSNVNNLHMASKAPNYGSSTSSTFGSSASSTSAFGSSGTAYGPTMMSPTSSSMAGVGMGMGGSTMTGGGSMGGSTIAGGRSMGGSTRAGGGSMGGSTMAGGGSMGGSTMAGGRAMGGSSMAGGGSMLSGGFGSQQNKVPNQPNKPVDMSAFDNLLPSKPKMAMSQMNQPRQMQPAGFGMQQQGMMGNMGMAGSQQGMMGGQRMMGNQGMMGNMGMQPQSNMNLGMIQPMNTSKPKNDFDDLFG